MQQQLQDQFNQIHTLIENSTPKSDGLFAGTLSLAYYHFYLYKAHDDYAEAEKAVAYVETVLDKINNTDLYHFGYSICNGIAGLAYMLHILQQEELIELEEEEIMGLEEFLFKNAKYMLEQTNHHDFLHGAMGIVYYFLERLTIAPNAGYAFTLIQMFCDKAVYSHKGTWFKNIVTKEDKEADINFSLSHGQSSFLILLAMAHQRGIKIELLPLLLDKGMELLLQYESPVNFDEEKYSLFPTAVTNEESSFSHRLAWCYGDLNIALALYKISLLPGKEKYKTKADKITATTILRKNEASTAATDSHICHGTAGLAQLYKAIYSITNNDAHKEAWHYWLEQTVKVYLPKELGNGFYKDKAGDLLEGLVGVNLALLSYQKPELDWSRILLL